MVSALDKVIAGVLMLILPALLCLAITCIASCESRVIDYIVVCPEGENNCTRYEPHEIKIYYK